MEINRKLEHLTEEQIEEVITMYKDKSIRLSNIISKYNIDVKPSGLLSILPPVSYTHLDVYKRQVVDDRASYVWTRGTRALSKNLTFEEQQAKSAEDSLRACLEILVAAEGGKVSLVEELLNEKTAVEDIMTQAIEAENTKDTSKNVSGRSENLRGCSVTQILYYINENHLVLAVTGDSSALLLTGYDTKNVSVYDPVTSETTTMAIADAQEYFEAYDCAFFAWIK